MRDVFHAVLFCIALSQTSTIAWSDEKDFEPPISLVVSKQHITSEHLEAWEKNSELRRLSVYNCELDEQVVPRLSQLSELVHLNLGRTKPIGDAEVQQLAALKKLRLLALEYTEVTDQGLASLKDMTDLDWLSLYGTKVTDKGLAQLAPLKKLKRLTLHRSAVRGPGLVHLYGLTELRELTLDGTVSKKDVDELQAHLPALKIQRVAIPLE